MRKHNINHIGKDNVGGKDHRVKCVDVEDRRIKGGTDCSSHEQPAGWEDKDSTPSVEETHIKCWQIVWPYL